MKFYQCEFLGQFRLLAFNSFPYKLSQAIPLGSSEQLCPFGFVERWMA